MSGIIIIVVVIILIIIIIIIIIIISPPRDLLPSIVLIKSQPSLTVFLFSSLRLSYIFWVAMVVGCSRADKP